MSTVYIQKEKVDHVILTNNTGAALVQYQIAVVGGLVVVADEAIASAEKGSFHVEENMVCQSSDFVTAEDTFATANADVFLDPSTGKLSDTSTAGYSKVGIVCDVKDSDGMITFVKQRNAEVVGA